MLDVELSLCSYMFRCKDPTYNPSSTRLFFMFVTFSLLIILVRTLDIASVLYLAVTVPLITSVNFTSARTFGILWCLAFACDITTYHPGLLIELFRTCFFPFSSDFSSFSFFYFLFTLFHFQKTKTIFLFSFDGG